MSEAPIPAKRRGLALSQALTRVLLVNGCERTPFGLVMAGVAGLGTVTWQDRSIVAGVCALLLGTVGLTLLRRMARHDPLFWRVYQRNRRYKSFYPARSTPWRAN